MENIFRNAAFADLYQKPKVIAAIPAYNEAKYIGQVVQQTKKYVHQVIVVDDGSTDETAQVAKTAGATVIRHEINQNYGGAIKSCLKAAREHAADILVTLDGDGQHNATEIPLLIAPVIKGEADIVIGSRFLNGHNGIPRYRKFGINVITWLYNFGSPVKLSDAQSGFRAYNKKALESITYLQDNKMAISVETIVKARKVGLVMQEVPISCKYHAQSSTLNPVIHGLSVALATVKYRLHPMNIPFPQENLQVTEAKNQ